MDSRVNYYEHHIGDYDSATAHLSWLEDCAYRRLICLYYRTEAPIPLDLKQACRLVRATSKQERAAVDLVLKEFFERREDGWHQKRCDEDLDRYQEGGPQRAARKANEADRNRRHREERAALFEALRAVGQHPDWNAPMTEIRALHQRYCTTPATAPATAPATLQQPSPATPATATHSHFPPPTTQREIETSPQAPCVSASPAHTRAREADREGFLRIQSAYPPFTGNQADWVLADRACQQQIEQGATWEQLEDAARRFAAFVARGGRSGPQYVDLPSKFFGKGLWRQPWEPPPTKAEARLSANVSVLEQFIAEGDPA